MKFSILTPSYGYGRFIGDSVRSVLAQRDVDVEHLVMDGGSQDETVDRLRELDGDPRLHWWSEPDNGQSDALNKALAKASGDWIGWLNADEFYLPGALQRVARLIERRPGIDVVHGDYVEVDEAGRVIRLVPEHPVSRPALKCRCCVISCTAFIRRSALPSRGWDPTMPSMMDWDLFWELFRSQAAFAYLDVPAAGFRRHGSQASYSADAHSDVEFAQLRRRHGLATSSTGVLMQRSLGRIDHVRSKLLTGAYMRQRRVVQVRGASLRWFAEETGRHTWEVLGVESAQ